MFSVITMDSGYGRTVITVYRLQRRVAAGVVTYSSHLYVTLYYCAVTNFEGENENAKRTAREKERVREKKPKNHTSTRVSTTTHRARVTNLGSRNGSREFIYRNFFFPPFATYDDFPRPEKTF